MKRQIVSTGDGAWTWSWRERRALFSCLSSFAHIPMAPRSSSVCLYEYVADLCVSVSLSPHSQTRLDSDFLDKTIPDTDSFAETGPKWRTASLRRFASSASLSAFSLSVCRSDGTTEAFSCSLQHLSHNSNYRYFPPTLDSLCKFYLIANVCKSGCVMLIYACAHTRLRDRRPVRVCASFLMPC